jgi:hypothetical protein
VRQGAMGFFLREALRLKGFCETWIKWITLAVGTGKVSINLNGKMGSFSRPLEDCDRETLCLRCFLTSLEKRWGL